MKLKKIIIFILTIFIMLPVKTYAKSTLTGNELFYIHGHTILKTTTESQLSLMYGTPKLITDTAFGGKGMTYYDSDFNWILHVETNASGVIKAIGGIGEDFMGQNYTYLEEDKDNTFSLLSGEAFDAYDRGILGEYNYNANYTEYKEYRTRFQANPALYKYGLQKHAVLFSKLIAKISGYEFPQTYIDEDLFYYNEQLIYNGSNLYDYAEKNGKDKEIKRISTSFSIFAYLPNPLSLGSSSYYHLAGSEYKYLFYDISLGDGSAWNSYSTTVSYINPDFMKQRKKIALTKEEQNILQRVLENYKQYNYYGELYMKSEEDLFTSPQDYTNLPLKPGVVNQNALLMSTAYINIARAGAGLNNLELSNDIATAAQYKATLVYYLNSHGYKVDHYPQKIDEIPQDFYDVAQKYMNENLYTGSITSSIVNALNDGYGDPIAGGHRYNILTPSYTTWGPGTANGQGVHKFSGYQSYDNELVAWPAKGITPIDMVYGGIGYWTARFYKNYKTTTVSKVTIKNLSSGAIYTIDKNNLKSSQRFANPSSIQVSFYDSGITYQHEDVFEITLHNITDTRTNKETDYTYRSVFYQLYQEDKVAVTDLTLNKNEITLGVNETERILAAITPTDATDKSVKFTSSNNRVATVRADGTVTALKPGTATITITSGNITKTVKIGVKDASGIVPSYLKGDLNENGIIEIADALEALYYVAGKKTSNDIKIAIGDMNENGSIEIVDALEILKIYKNS